MTEYLETQVDKFTFKVAKDRFYTTFGVWALLYGGTARIGLSDYLQQTSGDIAFADIQPAGTVLGTGEACASIETIKVDIDVLSPLSGRILHVNPLMESSPEMINQDPYGDGWLCEIEPYSWENNLEELMDAEEYFEVMKRQAEEEVKKK